MDAGEAGDQGGAVVRLELAELAAVDDAGDHLVDVVGHPGVDGDDVVQLMLVGDRIHRRDHLPGWRLTRAQRRDDVTHDAQGVTVIPGQVVDHTGGLGVQIPAAELFGKRTGTSKGKGGSMHMFDKERNLFGGHGIVGGQIGLGAGIAFADKYRKEDHVTLCFFGDGAARQGMLHETFNMAMTWKLPVIFVVENNKYAMGTSVERTSNVTDLSLLGASYAMPSETVDGMSPEAVCAAFQRAAARGRAGEGPTLLDIQTYRYKGHSMSDPQKYRTKEEVNAFQDRDPIEYVRGVLLAQGWATEAALKDVEQEVKDLVEECIRFAEESPLPEAHELYEDVYSDPYPFVRD